MCVRASVDTAGGAEAGSTCVRGFFGFVLLAALTGCSSGSDPAVGGDDAGGGVSDADTSSVDVVDAGGDAGENAAPDAGTVGDAGGSADAGNAASDAGSDAGPECFDDDDDGHTTCDGDCDDDPTGCGDGCFPGNGAADICDGHDQDCDGTIDEDPELVFYEDVDDDGFGDDALPASACTAPAGHVSDGGDCDDGDDAIFPGAAESCSDATDDDCDGRTDCEDDACDLDVACAACVDADSDGWFALGSCSGAADCDDGSGGCGAGCFPGNGPDVCDKDDQDCDGVSDEDPPLWYYDGDGDGYGDVGTTMAVCNEPENYAPLAGDCAPTDGMHWDDCGACIDADGDDRGTSCDLGNDCDESTAALYAATLLYEDLDRDGIGSNVTEELCLGASRPVGYVPYTGDCDDAEILRFAGAPEIPGDGIDNDCGLDGDVAIDDSSAVYVSDADGNDANAGTAASPLETIGAALTIARAGGKAIVLDEGFYASAGTFTLDVVLLGGFAYDGAMTWTRDVDSYVSDVSAEDFDVPYMESAAVWGATLRSTDGAVSGSIVAQGILIVADGELHGAATTTHPLISVLDVRGSTIDLTSARSTILLRSTIHPRNSADAGGSVRGAYVFRGAHLAVVQSQIDAGGCYAMGMCPDRSYGIEVTDQGDGTSTLHASDSDVTSGDVQYSIGVQVGVDTSAELDGLRISTPLFTAAQEATAVRSLARDFSLRDSVLESGNASSESVGLECQRGTIVNSYLHAGDSPTGVGLRVFAEAHVAHGWIYGGGGAESIGVDLEGSLLLANSVVSLGGSVADTGILVGSSGHDVALTDVLFHFGTGCVVDDGACYDTVPEVEACTFTGCTNAAGVLFGNPNAVPDAGSGAWVIQSGSICIDAGSDVDASFPEQDLSEDFFGSSRPYGAAPDLGPVEYVP